MNRKSKKFAPSGWTEKLVPVLLGVLTLLLVATIVLIILSITGVLPG
jgi:hypothetical protein